MIYPLDSVIQRLNNRGQGCSSLRGSESFQVYYLAMDPGSRALTSLAMRVGITGKSVPARKLAHPNALYVLPSCSHEVIGQ